MVTVQVTRAYRLVVKVSGSNVRMVEAALLADGAVGTADRAYDYLLKQETPGQLGRSASGSSPPYEEREVRSAPTSCAM